MKIKTVMKTSAALLTFLALSNCYLDGDYSLYDDGVEQAQGYQNTGVDAAAQNEVIYTETQYPAI